MPFASLLFAEMEVLHEIDGRQDRGAYADLGDVLFDLVLAVEVRDARLSIGGANRGEDEVDACGLSAVVVNYASSKEGADRVVADIAALESSVPQIEPTLEQGPELSIFQVRDHGALLAIAGA
jgi:hypothetical protein